MTTDLPKTGVTEYTTPNELELRIVRHVAAPREIVFQAWTTPAYVSQWLLGPAGWTMPVCEIDLRPGGAWRHVWRKGDGAEMAMGGVYREVLPPERVVSTESWGPEWPETVNTVTFTERAGLTTITLTVRYPTMAARDAALGTGMKEGVDQGFARLDRLVQTMR